MKVLHARATARLCPTGSEEPLRELSSQEGGSAERCFRKISDKRGGRCGVQVELLSRQ